MNRAVFLDRDGVLIRSDVINGKPYAIRYLADISFFPYVRKDCYYLQKAGYLLIMVTNQPDINRGLISLDTVTTMNNYIQKALQLNSMYMCTHTPEDQCLCRKPSPVMLARAAEYFDIDLSESYMIGDRWSDIEAGKKAGCHTIWIDRDYENDKEVIAPDYTTDNFNEAASHILGRQSYTCADWKK